MDKLAFSAKASGLRMLLRVVMVNAIMQGIGISKDQRGACFLLQNGAPSNDNTTVCN